MRTSRRPSFPNDVAFDTLPPVVIRKYFSSLERLRLAEDGRNLSRPPSQLSIHPTNNAGFTTQPSDTFSFLTHGITQTGHFFNGTRLRRRRCSAADITPTTVAWFASLPPAVQRKLFSREECSFYSQERDAIILDSADETLRRRSWHPTHFAAFDRRTSDDDATIVDCEELKEESRVDSAIDMGDYSIDGFRWLEDEGDLDLKLDDYHQAIAETNRRTVSVSAPVRRRSRRAPSLSSLSIRRGRSSTSSSRPPIEAPPTPAVPFIPPHTRASSFSLKHLRSQASISSIDPRATHYQDPAARMKLRLYLASPQKFDEAIEFGFPSVEEREQWNHIRPMTSPQPRPEFNRTFFHDDTPSLSGDDGDDADEPDTMFDPRTPEEAVFQMHRPSHKSSIDGSKGLRPFSIRRQPETYARGVTADREMTLHMTLTRPDLRSPEEQISQPDHQKKVNRPTPERIDVPVDGNAVTIWDTLPAEESKMKRFLRKLRLK
ncbi:uncharacterized protein PV07_11215 [Cladophialophora immunda]|uniref:Mucin n=1 Tax=Cladophialophora immunda TaxID=569365 RepID=A0A0D2BXD4_9EURO|nr:uncharacterized protein PV07_11215 [Cladophialophora immunda]KIW22975.1 hypothetical protein PV07_11215 [Cladophialophora immunda]OQU93732.1 hypothetical protein CLAIMM_00210 [Cladophialophora immunda]